MSNTYHSGPPPTTPEQRVVLMSADGWECFITDCCEQLKAENSYIQVKRLGGPGDKGRDVAGYLQFPPVAKMWDLYQAKAYDHALAPTDFLPDLAKFVFNVYNGTYPLPRVYYISGKKDVGTKLFIMLEKPDNLRQWLLDQWKAKGGDFGSFKQSLTPQLEAFIDTFDYKVIKEIKVADLLAIHVRSSKHWPAFGFLPLRGPDPNVPPTPTADEQTYVDEILLAYSDSEGCKIEAPKNIPSKHKRHFESCRQQFYFAEGLNRFSRDFVPNAFDELLGEVRIGISPVVDDSTHVNGLKRLNETLKFAPTLSLTTNPLKERIQSNDLMGACHHLANRGEVKWVLDE